MKTKTRSLSRLAGLAVAAALLASTVVHAQGTTNTNPAARTHVKIEGGQAKKYSSRLQKVVELNFTFGYHHNQSKPLIHNTLLRVAETYGSNGVPAFTVQYHVGPNGGTSSGLPTPDFTLADLMSAQVIFANQISAMGSNSLGAARRTAIQTAVESGVGYFHLHGSGDDETRQWSWYTNVLHPMNYAGHGANTNGPVYKNPAERNHIVTENVLTTGMTDTRMVPTSVDAQGNEVLTSEPVRLIRNEWYRFGNDIRTMPEHKDKVTVLSLYDPRGLTSELAAQYRRKGGNMYTYLFKVGNGMTHYLPAGHDNLEIMGGDYAFDGKVGDWDRYFAQVLFFLAGYNVTDCDASCNGLPIVDEKNHLTGTVYNNSSVKGYAIAPDAVEFDERRLAFSYPREERYDARVVDVSGKVMLSSSGTGTGYAFDQSSLKPGVYFLRLRVGDNELSKRYVLTGR